MPVSERLRCPHDRGAPYAIGASGTAGSRPSARSIRRTRIPSGHPRPADHRGRDGRRVPLGRRVVGWLPRGRRVLRHLGFRHRTNAPVRADLDRSDRHRPLLRAPGPSSAARARPGPGGRRSRLDVRVEPARHLAHDRGPDRCRGGTVRRELRAPALSEGRLLRARRNLESPPAHLDARRRRTVLPLLSAPVGPHRADQTTPPVGPHRCGRRAGCPVLPARRRAQRRGRDAFSRHHPSRAVCVLFLAHPGLGVPRRRARGLRGAGGPSARTPTGSAGRPGGHRRDRLLGAPRARDDGDAGSHHADSRRRRRTRRHRRNRVQRAAPTRAFDPAHGVDRRPFLWLVPVALAADRVRPHVVSPLHPPERSSPRQSSRWFPRSSRTGSSSSRSAASPTCGVAGRSAWELACSAVSLVAFLGLANFPKITTAGTRSVDASLHIPVAGPTSC